MVGPASAPRICTPGAVTSGFNRSKLPAGPRELDAASASATFGRPTPGKVIWAVAVLGLALPNATKALPSTCLAPNTGTVVPGADGRRVPPRSLAMMTAMAPAAEALFTFTVKSQPPRRMTTTAPVSEPAA